MAAMSSTASIFSLFLVLHFFSLSHSASPDAICSTTPFPFFCKTVLPRNNNSATVHDYGRLAIQSSLARTRTFLSLVNGYLNFRFTLPATTVRALEDCQLLLNLNLDLLSNTYQKLGSRSTLRSSDVDDNWTFLSATMTNLQTCSDGIQMAASSSSSAGTLKNALLAPFSNGSMLYSVSLALFSHGWGNGAHPDVGGVERGGRKLLQTVASGVNVRQTVVVNPDGSGDFTTIGDAVAAAPNNTDANGGYFLIHVVAGVYEEYVTIAKNKKYLMMVGDGINQTVITGNRSVVDGWTTFNSATFAVVGQGFVGVNITFRNTAGAIKHQAVAVRNGADLSAFYQCSFEGYQDTLYAHSLRQFYRECDVYGTVDFIFGNAAVVLQSCNIYPRLPMQGQFNAVTAQGRTDVNQNTGTSIHNCSIRAAPDLAASNGTTRTYLGRPWKEYSRAVYMQSFMDGSIDPAGWSAWSGDFALNTSYYAEFDNSGPGSVTTNRVNWVGYHVINQSDAGNFTVSNFILGDNWLPAGVPFTGGLL